MTWQAETGCFDSIEDLPEALQPSAWALAEMFRNRDFEVRIPPAEDFGRRWSVALMKKDRAAVVMTLEVKDRGLFDD